MKKFIILLLLMAVCFASTIKIEGVPASVTPVDGKFQISFNVTCTKTNTTDLCDMIVPVFYTATIGIEKVRGWEIDSLEKNTVAYGEADCIFGGAENKTLCQYNNVQFTHSEKAQSPKLKISTLVKGTQYDQYVETQWITVDYTAPVEQIQVQIPENNTPPQNNTPPVTNEPAKEEKLGFFEGIWKWIMDFFGIK